MVRLRHFYIIIVAVMLFVPRLHARQNQVYVCEGLKKWVVTLTGNYCIIEQIINEGTPPFVYHYQKDVFHYIRKKDTLFLRNLDILAPNTIESYRTFSFQDMCFRTPDYIQYQGNFLDEYPLTPKHTSHSNLLLADAVGYMYRFPKKCYASIELSDSCMSLYTAPNTPPILLLNSQINLNDATGASSVKNLINTWVADSTLRTMIEYPKSVVDWVTYSWDWGYYWYKRERLTANIDVSSALLEHTFVDDVESYYFGANYQGVYHNDATSTQYDFTYTTSQSYVILRTTQYVDSLLYDNGVLYYALINQHQPDSSYLHRGYRQASTGTMTVRAWKDLSRPDISSEQVGTTFQHYYIPINYHKAK